MKFKEINRRYTEKVAEYIVKGYTINTGTMSGSGSQLELAHIDLTDGEKIVRIMLAEAGGWYGDWRWDLRWEGYKLVVGIATDKIRINDFDSWSTICNNKLDIIEEEIFFRVSDDRRKDWFVNEKEAKAGYEKKVSRYSNKNEEVYNDIDLGEKGARIVLPFVKSQNRCERARACDVKVVKKIRYGKVRWYVNYKNRTWTLA